MNPIARSLLRCSWPAVLLFLAAAPPASAQRVSARDKAAIEVIDRNMAAAEKRYLDSLVRVSNNDPRGAAEGDAALEDMEDAIDACIKQRGCQVHTLLTAYKRLLKQKVDAEAAAADSEGEESEEGLADALDDDSDHTVPPEAAQLPEAARTAALLNDQRHAFDRMVQYNPAVQAGIRRWLTDMRTSLVTSYENYQNLRYLMWPEWEKQGLPEALLFGIMAKESNGRVHVSSRAGAAGLMQFMPATARRFGLGPDGAGFDTRYDPRSAAEASAAYMNERLRELNNDIEMSLAAYNGGEGRALRVHTQGGGRGFWNESQYRQFPAETQDYVPMVIAAAWLFLHPRQYGLDFPKVSPQPAPLRLVNTTTLYELTICLGSGDTRYGYMRALRNLNPRYQADSWIPQGTTLAANTRIVGLYNRYCVSGPRAELARALVTADPNLAIIGASPLHPNVAVGAVTPVEGVPTTVATGQPAPVQPKVQQVRDYRVASGDTLGGIARRHQCSVQALAKANGLRAPAYALRQGQRLKLEGCRK